MIAFALAQATFRVPNALELDIGWDSRICVQQRGNGVGVGHRHRAEDLRSELELLDRALEKH
jgi:hypothetical protein